MYVDAPVGIHFLFMSFDDQTLIKAIQSSSSLKESHVFTPPSKLLYFELIVYCMASYFQSVLFFDIFKKPLSLKINS